MRKFGSVRDVYLPLNHYTKCVPPARGDLTAWPQILLCRLPAALRSMARRPTKTEAQLYPTSTWGVQESTAVEVFECKARAVCSLAPGRRGKRCEHAKPTRSCGQEHAWSSRKRSPIKAKLSPDVPSSRVLCQVSACVSEHSTAPALASRPEVRHTGLHTVSSGRSSIPPHHAGLRPTVAALCCPVQAHVRVLSSAGDRGPGSPLPGLMCSAPPCFTVPCTGPLQQDQR